MEKPQDFYESAVAFGSFQRLLAEYPAQTLHETIPNFHNTISRFRDFERAVERDACGRADSVREEIAFAMARREEAGTLVPVSYTHLKSRIMKGITLIREAFFTMNSNLVFYGTGAAEAIPSPFCSCRVCQFARERGGREERARSMFRVNEELSVDLGPDAVLRAMRFGDLTGLRHVLVTHTHLDHFCYDMMEVRSMSRDAKEPLVFWLTDEMCIRDRRRSALPGRDSDF